MFTEELHCTNQTTSEVLKDGNKRSMTNEDVSSWLCENVFSRLDVSVIAGLKVFNFEVKKNILDVELQLFVFEPTSYEDQGLFKLHGGSYSGREWSEYFPTGLIYEYEKNRYVFESEEDCENLGESGYLDIDSPYESEGKFYLWDDTNIPDAVLEELFELNRIGNAAVKIIEHFELYEKDSSIPDLIPKRLIPYLKKAISEY